MAVVDRVMVLVFLGITFLVGSFFYKWVGNRDDFYVAGRNLTPFILAAVITTTTLSS